MAQPRKPRPRVFNKATRCADYPICRGVLIVIFEAESDMTRIVLVAKTITLNTFQIVFEQLQLFLIIKLCSPRLCGQRYTNVLRRVAKNGPNII